MRNGASAARLVPLKMNPPETRARTPIPTLHHLPTAQVHPELGHQGLLGLEELPKPEEAALGTVSEAQAVRTGTMEAIPSHREMRTIFTMHLPCVPDPPIPLQSRHNHKHRSHLLSLHLKYLHNLK